MVSVCVCVLGISLSYIYIYRVGTGACLIKTTADLDDTPQPPDAQHAKPHDCCVQRRRVRDQSGAGCGALAGNTSQCFHGTERAQTPRTVY